MNQGTIAVVLLVLPYPARRNVRHQNTGAGQTQHLTKDNDSELMHIGPNSRRRILPKVFSLYNIYQAENALDNKPRVYRYVQYSDVATCQDVSILLNYTENSRDVYQQETVKKVYTGS